MGRGTVPPDSPEFLNRSRRDALEADRPASCSPARCSTSACASARRSPPSAKVIQLDMDATLIGQNRQADVPLVGNLACTFDMR